ncbi:MAG: NAD(P)H-binding protein [Phycisphaerales bacterium]
MRPGIRPSPYPWRPVPQGPATLEPPPPSPLILVTGSTGYIGGRLAPRLVERGCRIRCLVRSEAKLRARPWAQGPNVEIVTGDAGDPAALARAMRGCDAAYSRLFGNSCGLRRASGRDPAHTNS